MKMFYSFTIAIAFCATVSLNGQVPFGNNSLDPNGPAPPQDRKNDNRNIDRRPPNPPPNNQDNRNRSGRNENRNGNNQNQPASPYDQFGPSQNPFPIPHSQNPGLQNANSPRPPSGQSRIDAKLREYKNAKETARENEIEKELKELLNQQFDDRMKGPVERVDASRKRLDELKKQIKNRDSKSDEIIDLRLQVVTNQVIGLGWGPATAHAGPNRPAMNAPLGMPANTGPDPGINPNFNHRNNFAPNNNRPSIANNPNNGGWNRGGSNPFGQPNTPFGNPNGNQRAVENHDNRNPMKDEPKPAGLHELLEDYRTAKDDSERKTIRKEIKERLREEFDQHQKQLKQSADRIEEQISSIESNVEERKKKKNEIVDLKLKMLINQAKGLGF